MKAKAARKVSFVELCIEERRAKLSNLFLYKIKANVDWERLRKTATRREHLHSTRSEFLEITLLTTFVQKAHKLIHYN